MAYSRWWSIKTVTFKPRRLAKIASVLLPAWRNRENGFAGLIPPEIAFLPKDISYGSREHALLLFFWAWLNRRGVKARVVMARSAKLIFEYPEIFDPKAAGSEDGFEKFVPEGLVGFQNNDGRIEKWQENLKRLAYEYESDPRRIFSRTNLTRGELIGLLRTFHGFGPKTASLFIAWCQEVDWTKSPNSDIDMERQIKLSSINAFPVDSWAMKLFRQWDLVKEWKRDHHHVLSETIGQFMDEFCKRHNVSCLELTQAIWHLGSVICMKKPKDKARAARYCKKHCPMEDFCRYAVSSPDLDSKGKLGWDQAVRRKREP